MRRLSITSAVLLGPSLAFAAAWFSRFCGLRRVTLSGPKSEAAASMSNAVVVDNPYGLIAHDCFGPSYRDDILGIFALIVLPLFLGFLLRPNERPHFVSAGLLGAVSAVTYTLCMSLLRGRSGDSAVVFVVMVAVGVAIGGLAAVLGAWFSQRVPSNKSLERTREG
jgi:hypothetical protein